MVFDFFVSRLFWFLFFSFDMFLKIRFLFFALSRLITHCSINNIFHEIVQCFQKMFIFKCLYKNPLYFSWQDSSCQRKQCESSEFYKLFSLTRLSHNLKTFSCRQLDNIIRWLITWKDLILLVRFGCLSWYCKDKMLERRYKRGEM